MSRSGSQREPLSVSVSGSLEEQVARPEAGNAVLREQGARLVERIAALERRPGLKGRSSGKPPSSGGLAKPAARRRTRSLREKTGSQPGRKGETLRRAAPPDRVEDHVPACCRGFGESLSGAAPAGAAVARPLFDLPTPRPLEVVAHRVHGRRCALGLRGDCGGRASLSRRWRRGRARRPGCASAGAGRHAVAGGVSGERAARGCACGRVGHGSATGRRRGWSTRCAMRTLCGRCRRLRRSARRTGRGGCSGFCAGPGAPPGWRGCDRLLVEAMAFHEGLPPLAPAGKRGARRRRKGRNPALRRHARRDATLRFRTDPGCALHRQ